MEVVSGEFGVLDGEMVVLTVTVKVLGTVMVLKAVLSGTLEGPYGWYPYGTGPLEELL